MLTCRFLSFIRTGVVWMDQWREKLEPKAEIAETHPNALHFCSEADTGRLSRGTVEKTANGHRPRIRIEPQMEE
jgi:hypothetical protein